MNKQILISAGDAITARLIEEAGFDGIWVSGFEASARLGLADNGSLTMTEMLNITKPIIDATKLPVYVDVDTGYGNFARTVREFEAIGAAGISVEDNLYEKANSLWGDSRPLLTTEEFCRKISIARNNLKIIARTEALIRGYGIEEAIMRGEAYAAAGADIVLIHSRDGEANEIYDIISHWTKETPLAIVPTKFPFKTNKDLFNMGFDMVVWANQTERAKIKATRECLGSLRGSDCAAYIEANLSATLDDMKGLTRND
jgi:phosphoenolpyruvate phosphomutase